MFDVKLRVTPSPHIRDSVTTQKIMLDVLIALIPAGIMGVINFGVNAFVCIAVGTGFAVLAEYLWQRITKKEITVSDLSAAVTGLLIAYNVPPATPWWMVAIGSVFAIIIVKQLFGGLGFNVVNPALAARAILMASWPQHMTFFTAPHAVDAVSSPTPLAVMAGTHAAEWSDVGASFVGNIGGCIGETSALLLILGGAYLLYRGVINWRIPGCMLGGALITLVLFCGPEGLFSASLPLVLTQLFSGGLMLGAIFMATDYVTSPITPKAHIIYGFGCGVLAMLIRLFGGYAEGVSYAILLMNVAAPLIERYTTPHPLGLQKKKKEAKVNA